MKSRLKTFGDFILLKESMNEIEEIFPAKWKKLQDLGFYDASSLRIKANGNILLKNDKFNYYPEGIILQLSSGYVRDKGARSGFIKKGYTLDQMVDYLIDRFEKYEAQTSGDVSSELVTFLKKISRSRSSKNPATGKFDFNGGVELTKANLDYMKEKGIKIGKIGKDFHYNGYQGVSESILNLEDLEFFPDEVKGKFDLRNCSFNGFSDLRPFPTKMGNGLGLSSIGNLKSLSGSTINSGKNTKINVFRCDELESLGEDLPDEVNDISVTSSWTSKGMRKFTTLNGCPKIVHNDFTIEHTAIKNLKGGPERVGRKYEVENNENLTSLEGFPIVFDGVFLSKIISCWFSLEERVKIISEGIYYTYNWNNERGEPKEASLFQKEFVATSLSIKNLQELIDQNPEKMAIVLKEVIKEPYFKSLRWPENLKGEVDLLSSLSDVGL